MSFTDSNCKSYFEALRFGATSSERETCPVRSISLRTSSSLRRSSCDLLMTSAARSMSARSCALVSSDIRKEVWRYLAGAMPARHPDCQFENG